MNYYSELSNAEMISIDGGSESTYEWGCKVGVALRQFATIVGILSLL